MDYEKYFSERLALLRTKAGVSARDMSLSMGQSSGYINKIENRQNFPSMTGFFAICDYLDVTPEEFFDLKADNPCELKRIEEKLKMLPDNKLKAINIMVDVLLEKS